MFHVRRALLALVLAMPLAGRAADVPLETDDQKAIYGYGAQLAQQLSFLELSKDEIATFLAGFNDQSTGKSRVDLADPAQGAKLEAFYKGHMKNVLAHENDEAKKFIDKSAKEKGAVKTDSGLVYKEVAAGKGDSPGATDTVKVHYHGTLRDGTVFDSSKDRGEPVEFPLNGVIPCWTEGLQKMKTGGKSRLICPSSIAYGDNGAPPKIKPGAALAFDVELISVTKGAADASPHGGSAPTNNPHTMPPKGAPKGDAKSAPKDAPKDKE
jgi:FKBP-type peptidyl-prolyl cis-trans isomerase FkpA